MAQHHPPRSHAIHSRVRSFSRAGGRLRPVQAEALAQLGPRYVVDVPRADAVRTVSPSFRLDPEKVFGHVGQVRPLIVEVGSGSGEALLAHAAAHPETDYLAVEVFSARNRVGVYLSVLTEGAVQTGDEVRVVSSPGHRVTCRRWFAHHDPRDAQGLLHSEIFGNCVIAPFTRKYVSAAAHEQVG